MHFSTDSEKKLAIAVLVIIGLIFLYSISLNVTGQLTAVGLEEKLTERELLVEEIRAEIEEKVLELNTITSRYDSCEIAVAEKSDQVNECNINLESKDASLKLCSTEKSALEGDLSSCKSRILASDDKYTTALDNYNTAISDYSNLAASSAASICCSFEDFLSATTKNWEISNNKIICNTGSNTVNCDTGNAIIG